ncbi:MAG: Hsp70 family protein, partial [Acidimicrobiia bacterium]
MTYVLGIDIGTTYSAAALARHGRAEIAALGAISTAVPTAVYLLPDGGFLTAEEAIRRGAADPDRLVLYFKRRLGDPVPLSVAGESYDPGVLLGEMLSWVRQRAVELEGGPPDEVVVTHPANWGDYKKDLLETAISNAGIYPFSLLTEPEAAAVHYSSQERTEVGSLIAVYDLGGGTFDAALLRKTENRYDFVGEPLGVERLGGIDFDDLIWGHVVTTLGGSLGQIDLENPSNRRAVAALRRSMSEVKESLSSDSQVVVPVVLPGIDTEIRITRAEFEGLIRPFLEDTLLALQHLLDNAGVTTDDVNAVLLVGGSSRIPLVA